jgi:hypothetical protein
VKWWTVFAVAVLVAAGCGETPRPAPVKTPERFDSYDRLPAKTGGFDALVARRKAEERALRAAIAKARRSRTVEGALRVARLTGRITPGAETSMRKEWAAANRTVARLSGTPRTELGYVVGAVRALAAERRLTSDRLRPTFLVLRQNARFWPTEPVPAAGWRTTFGRDPAIFQYYPGRGLQLQPLASWGRANAIAGACLAALRSRTTKDTCRKAALTRSLDRLASLGARRSGYLAWEYYFAYGTGAPPWVSGMTQATATQALARGYRALGHRRWKRAAERALGAFEQAPPSGVAVPAPGGTHYALYSFSPSHRAKAYCRAGKRFARYEREPTRIGLERLKGTRWDRTRTVRFSLSKVSSVKVRVWGTRGLSVSRDFAQLPRGTHSFAWRPPGRGRFRVRIEAKGPSGPVGVETRTVRITTPAKPKPKKRKTAPRPRKTEQSPPMRP